MSSNDFNDPSVMSSTPPPLPHEMEEAEEIDLGEIDDAHLPVFDAGESSACICLKVQRIVEHSVDETEATRRLKKYLEVPWNPIFRQPDAGRPGVKLARGGGRVVVEFMTKTCKKLVVAGKVVEP